MFAICEKRLHVGVQHQQGICGWTRGEDLWRIERDYEGADIARYSEVKQTTRRAFYSQYVKNKMSNVVKKKKHRRGKMDAKQRNNV
jgi:hypothetical protein